VVGGRTRWPADQNSGRLTRPRAQRKSKLAIGQQAPQLGGRGNQLTAPWLGHRPAQPSHRPRRLMNVRFTRAANLRVPDAAGTAVPAVTGEWSGTYAHVPFLGVSLPGGGPHLAAAAKDSTPECISSSSPAGRMTGPGNAKPRLGWSTVNDLGVGPGGVLITGPGAAGCLFPDPGRYRGHFDVFLLADRAEPVKRFARSALGAGCPASGGP
jgi:hypothetical protein